MDKILGTIRKRLGRKAIVPNAKKHLNDVGRQLDDFYDVKRVPMEVKKSVAAEGEPKKGKVKSGKKNAGAEEEPKGVESQERLTKENETTKERRQKRWKR